MTGRAYAFIRWSGAPVGPVNFGHVGWGFEIPAKTGASTFYCGSTENIAGSAQIYAPGDNGWWARLHTSEAAMFNEMRHSHLGSNNAYDEVVIIPMATSHSANAKATADQTRLEGYTLIGNNCMDHTGKVLEAYGVGWQPNGPMPWKQTHSAPAAWFQELAKYLVGSNQGHYQKL